jgi:lipopolysaccharide/colanic/teichoic acid biosynthesis glycosyltransferase
VRRRVDIVRRGIRPGLGRRTLDVVISAVGLAVTAPLLLVLMALVRVTSPGPALFRQTRVGQGWTPFAMYKLRTMKVDHTGPELTRRDDPRVTAVGRFLRSTSLDELPQLLNILLGQMTLAGPRPETPTLASRYPQQCRWVFAHRPGLTGPAQIRMRDDLPASRDMESHYLEDLVPLRTALDRLYLDRPTLPRTLKLLAATVAQCCFLRSRSCSPTGLDRSGEGTTPESRTGPMRA